MVDEAISTRLLLSVADQAMDYRFKVWGFGEEICLHALLEYGQACDESRPAEFVGALVRPWCEAKARSERGLELADHVAPGAVILDLFDATGDEVYLEAALLLGGLYRAFTEVDGVAVHRPDLGGLNHLIWVDCMALDGPFLARLATATGDESWFDRAGQAALSYARALIDERFGLFRHGYDTSTCLKSDCCWARGNGWAMHGLLDTVLELPDGHPARAELTDLLESQVTAVLRLQSASGHWHTVLDDPTTPLETSAAAFYASAVLKARRRGLLASLNTVDLERMVERAVAAVVGSLDDGALPVSYATPVGTRETYAHAPLGTFPWGQGPLLLTLLEARNAAPGRTGGNQA